MVILGKAKAEKPMYMKLILKVIQNKFLSPGIYILPIPVHACFLAPSGGWEPMDYLSLSSFSKVPRLNSRTPKDP